MTLVSFNQRRRSEISVSQRDSTHRESDVIMLLPTVSTPSDTSSSRPGTRHRAGPLVRSFDAWLRQLNVSQSAEVGYHAELCMLVDHCSSPASTSIRWWCTGIRLATTNRIKQSTGPAVLWPPTCSCALRDHSVELRSRYLPVDAKFSIVDCRTEFICCWASTFQLGFPYPYWGKQKTIPVFGVVEDCTHHRSILRNFHAKRYFLLSRFVVWVINHP